MSGPGDTTHPQQSGDYLGPLIRGVHLRDWPKVLWLRLTYCRRYGHLFTSYGVPEADDYCDNCGTPRRRRHA